MQQPSQQDPQARVRLLEEELTRARAEASRPVRKFTSFSEALVGMRRGARFKRQGWDGALCAQVPDAGSKMTQPYLYFDDGRARVPYAITQDDLFSDDWLEVDSPSPGVTVRRRPDGSWDVESCEAFLVPRFRQKNGRDPSQGEIVQLLTAVREHCEAQAHANPRILDFTIQY